MAVTSYTVTRRDGCTLIFGLMPVEDFSALAKSAPGAVLSPQLAQLAQANFAWGQPAEVAALVETLTVDRSRGLKPLTLDRWLAVGQRGASSEAIVTVLRGLPIGHATDHPHDPDDLKRCRLLLEEVPDLVPDLPRMRSASPVWAALVDHWEELCHLMDSEAPHWRAGKGSAPKTYARMRALITDAS